MIKKAVSLPNSLTSFKKWCDNIRQDLPFLKIPFAKEESQWREWALELFSMNMEVFLQAPQPTPLLFDTWRQWAAVFVHYCLTH